MGEPSGDGSAPTSRLAARLGRCKGELGRWGIGGFLGRRVGCADGGAAGWVMAGGGCCLVLG